MAEIIKELPEIETLKQIKKNIQEEIGKLQITLGNLQAQAHTEQIKKEQDIGMQDNERMNKYAVEERKIEAKRIEAEKRIDIAETIGSKLNDREREIERREQKTLNLETLIAGLNKQRANFEEYKTDIENKLEEAKITIAEANAIFEKIEIEKQMLLGRETKLKELEKYWNDLIGMLEAEKKQFQIEKENFIGLGKSKVEVTNG